MGNRGCELNMPHALAPHFGKRDFNAALFANDTLVLHALVLAAQAFVILHGSKNARAKKSIAFRLERTVVDGFRLFDFTERPLQDLFGRSNRNANLIECLRRNCWAENVHDLLVHVSLLLLCGIIRGDVIQIVQTSKQARGFPLAAKL